MEFSAYLARIGHTGPVSVDAGTLAGLHLAHAWAIPFENLDIQATPQRPIRTDADGVFEKLVAARRGGYCFEQNTLFRLALEAIGFSCRRVLARVMWGTGQPGARTHLFTLVDVDGDVWLADVGFGGHGLVSPLRFVEGEQEVHGERFRLVPSVLGRGAQLETLLGADWRPMYAFDPDEPVLDADIQMGNHMTQTLPDSRFTAHRILARNRPGERLSVLNGEFKVRRGDQVEVTRITDEAMFASLVRQRFGLELPAALSLRPHPDIAP